MILDILIGLIYSGAIINQIFVDGDALGYSC